MSLPPRLEGDHLFCWAQTVAREEQIVQAKQSLAIEYLTDLGYTPGEYLLTNDGYIISAAENDARVRTYSALPPESALTPPEDHRPPGNGSPGQDLHTEDWAESSSLQT